MENVVSDASMPVKIKSPRVVTGGVALNLFRRRAKVKQPRALIIGVAAYGDARLVTKGLCLRKLASR